MPVHQIQAEILSAQHDALQLHFGHGWTGSCPAFWLSCCSSLLNTRLCRRQRLCFRSTEKPCLSMVSSDLPVRSGATCQCIGCIVQGPGLPVVTIGIEAWFMA